MCFEVGDIIVVRGTIFKESNMYDTHFFGRPVLIVGNNDLFFYYLTMTSQSRFSSNKHQYYYKGLNNSKARFTGFIDCEHIYKRQIDIYPVLEKLDNKTLNDLLNGFVTYQEAIKKDEYYDDIQGIVKQYIR